MLKAKAKEKGQHLTAAEDKAYDIADHVANLRKLGVTPHVALNNFITRSGKARQSAIDERATRHDGYGMSQTRRKMIECILAGASNTALCARPNIAAWFVSPEIF